MASLQGSASSSPCGFHVLGLNILELLFVFDHEQVIHTHKSLINNLLSADGIWTVRYFLISILLFSGFVKITFGFWCEFFFFCRSIFYLKSVLAKSMWIGSSGFNPSPFSFATNFKLKFFKQFCPSEFVNLYIHRIGSCLWFWVH